MTDDEFKKFRRRMTTARREITKAVERAQGIDMREGHRAEAVRQAMAARDAARELVRVLEAK